MRYPVPINCSAYPYPVSPIDFQYQSSSDLFEWFTRFLIKPNRQWVWSTTIYLTWDSVLIYRDLEYHPDAIAFIEKSRQLAVLHSCRVVFENRHIVLWNEFFNLEIFATRENWVSYIVHDNHFSLLQQSSGTTFGCHLGWMLASTWGGCRHPPASTFEAGGNHVKVWKRMTDADSTG